MEGLLEDTIELARISSNGQITLPIAIRRKLGLKAGDKVLFYDRGDGQILVNNASVNAIVQAQKAFAGVAQQLGNPSEEDIQSWVDEVRYKGCSNSESSDHI
jgi:AbrB family looped-hinge helix DNA binding protein